MESDREANDEPHGEGASAEDKAKKRKRRRLPFRLDILPFFRSRSVEEARSRWWEFGWDRTLEEDLRWRARALFAVGVLAGMLVLGAAVWFFLREAKRDGVSEQGVFKGRVEGQAEPVRVAAGVELEGEVEVVKATVSAFLAADTLWGKRKWVVASDGLGDRMANYYASNPARKQLVYDFPVIALRVDEGGNYYLVQALTTSGERQNFAVLPDGGDGRPKIAWEAHVGYSEVDWDRYLTERPPESKEMRVYLELSDYYAPPFEDREDFLSVRLTRPGADRELQGYVSKVASRGMLGLAKLLLDGGRQPALVRLRFLPGSETPAVLVEELVHEGWFRPRPRGGGAETGSATPAGK